MMLGKLTDCEAFLNLVAAVSAGTIRVCDGFPPIVADKKSNS